MGWSRPKLRPIVALGILAVACATPEGLGSATPRPTSAPEARFQVQVDAKAPSFNLATTAYFPGELRVHPGDTVRFNGVDTGQPHTVTFGRLIEDLITDMAQLPPALTTQSHATPEVEALAARRQIPELIAGVPPQRYVPGAAGQACFLDSGAPPETDPCAPDAHRARAFKGQESFYNLGYVGDSTVSMQLATSVAPGVYHFICLHHLGSMVGTLTVVPSNVAVPSPDEVTAQGKQRLDHVIGALAARLAAVPDSGTTVAAGIAASDAPEGLAAVFLPRRVTIPVGGSVEWTLTQSHVIAFNAPQDAIGVITRGPDGVVRFNPKAVAPVGVAKVPDPGPSRAPLFEGGSWDGKGFHSSGFVSEAPGSPIAYRLTFTRAGTYVYKCAIHADMEGTINVGP